MKLSPKLISLLAMPFAGMLISFWIWHAVTITPALTPMEKELMSFSPVNTALFRPVAQTVSGLTCPIPRTPPPSTASAEHPKAYPPVPLAVMAPSKGGYAKKELPEPEYRLSLVLLDEGRKMAIVNGQVLKEGETLGALRVARIEKTRVNLKGVKGELWVNLE